MDLFESDIHSFVIKIWLEESAAEAEEVIWRGQITHVPSSKQGFFMNLNDIPLFIMPYLEFMGVRPLWQWRVQSWLRKQHAKTNR